MNAADQVGSSAPRDLLMLSRSRSAAPRSRPRPPSRPNSRDRGRDSRGLHGARRELAQRLLIELGRRRLGRRAARPDPVRGVRLIEHGEPEEGPFLDDDVDDAAAHVGRGRRPARALEQRERAGFAKHAGGWRGYVEAVQRQAVQRRQLGIGCGHDHRERRGQHGEYRSKRQGSSPGILAANTMRTPSQRKSASRRAITVSTSCSTYQGCRTTEAQRRCPRHRRTCAPRR